MGGLRSTSASRRVTRTNRLSNPPGTNGRTALATARAVYTPPPATGNSPFDFPDVAEVRVFTNRGEGKLVGAIELVSPGNKDRDAKREAFVAKCLDYLAAGACVVVINVVTERRANLHNEIVRRIGAPADVELPGESHLYAVTYRPVIRKDQPNWICGWTLWPWVNCSDDAAPLVR